MDDQTFHTLCVMAATLRAGRAGRDAPAWAEAVRQAVVGYGVIASNRQALGRFLSQQADQKYDTDVSLDTDEKEVTV